jgi:hypothetical protein
MRWTKSSLLAMAAVATSSAIILLVAWVLFAPELLATHR